MKTIGLTCSKVAIVDDDTFDYLNQWKWQYDGHGYASRRETIGYKKSKTVLMHREIIGTPKGMETDHINGNGLDNRKSNLRICTTSQNGMNRDKQLNNTSGYKGVRFDKRGGKWQAYIRFDHKFVHLGLFIDAKEAAKAYDIAALRLFGKFAKTNFLG